MNQLGFAVKVVSDGAYNALTCNNGSWTRNIIDPRHFLSMFSNLVGTDNSVTAISFYEYGTYIMQLRDIPGHTGDCLSTWLFIPYNLDIDDSQVMNAYNYAKEILSLSSLEPKKDEIKEFFDRTYPLKENSCTYVPSTGELFGLRYFSSETGLRELLGRKRYQQYYSQYKVVFLLDKNSRIKVYPENISKFRDLTKCSLDEYCVLMPPSDSDKEIARFGNGTSIVLNDRMAFEKPVRGKRGSQVKLTVRREGFEDIPLKTVTLTNDVETVSFVEPLIWRKRVNRAFFDIRNRDGNHINVNKISVNDHDITNNEILINEDDCRNATVEIQANEYKTLECKVDLLELQDKIRITMERAECSKDYKIFLSNGKEATLTLRSQYMDMSDKSPLVGYSLDSARKELYTSIGYKIKYWAYGVFTAIGFAVAAICYSTMDSYFDTHEFRFGWPPVVKKENVPVNEYDDSEDDSDNKKAAADYLNNNEKWSKAAMDTLTALPQGLYDDIKNYCFEKLINTDIEDCRQFEDVKKAAQKAIDNNIHMSNCYNDAPDSTITIMKWIEKVNKQIEKEVNERAKNQHDGSEDDVTEVGTSLSDKVRDKQGQQRKKVTNVEKGTKPQQKGSNENEQHKNGGL